MFDVLCAVKEFKVQLAYKHSSSLAGDIFSQCRYPTGTASSVYVKWLVFDEMESPSQLHVGS